METNRPSHWAEPLVLEGVPNFYRVTTNLYRSAQPTPEGFTNLAKFGIKTVINLRWLHSDREVLQGLGIDYVHIPMVVLDPDREDLLRFLRVVLDTNRLPVLVHCEHGADRTGLMCAAYRVVVQGWSKDEAIKEMMDGGFGMHRIWRHLPRWLNELDVTEIRRAVGLIHQPETTNRTVTLAVDGEGEGRKRSSDSVFVGVTNQPVGGLKGTNFSPILTTNNNPEYTK